MARREAPEINAGSMADIAFLLLIFFLVTTTMDVDKGISRKLPPIIEDPIDKPPPIKEKNVFVVLINSQDNLFVEEDYMDIDDLREAAKEFISNFGKDPASSDNPQKAVISVQNDRGTSYEMFIAVQNELTAAYNELRDEESKKRFGKVYSELNDKESKEIQNYYPMKISEAEPVNLGG
jgi:biopolymer transport protein ExbD